jgi:RNAse (barnase) inhibitor barstar
MKVIEINCAGIKSEAELWQRYLDAAKPEHGEGFGRNLDAFWDVVEGGGPGWPGDATLVFRGSAFLASLGPQFFDAFREIAKDAVLVKVVLA